MYITRWHMGWEIAESLRENKHVYNQVTHGVGDNRVTGGSISIYITR